MNDLIPHSEQYVFPTSRPALPSDLAHSDWERIESDFENHPAMVRRRGVTFWIVTVGAAVCVAKTVAFGFSAPLFFGCCAICVAGYILRPAQRGTKQSYATPDMWPATRSETATKQTTIVIVNNVTVNQ